MTPLMLASVGGHDDCVSVLLSSGAHIDFVSANVSIVSIGGIMPVKVLRLYFFVTTILPYAVGNVSTVAGCCKWALQMCFNSFIQWC